MESIPAVPLSATAKTAAVDPSPDTTAPVEVRAQETVAPTAVGTTPVVTLPQQPQLAPEPNCTLVGTKLTIHPQLGEVSYDIIVIKQDGDNEETVGSCKLAPPIMPNANLVVENLFNDKIDWLKSPENNGATYVIRVFAVNQAGVQSAPKSFPPTKFLFSKGSETGEVTTTPPPTVTPPVEPKTEKVPTSVVVLSPEDRAALNAVPARLSKIERDLGALPKERSAWGMLRDMTLGLEQIKELLTRLQGLFGDKPAGIVDLLAQTKKLNDRVEKTRALRSDKWNNELHPCLMEIKELLRSVNKDPGTPGELLLDEVKTIIGIVSNTDPGMTMTDIHSVLPRCREIHRELSELLTTEEAAAKANEAAKAKVEADAAKKAEAEAKAKAEAQIKADAKAKAEADAAIQAETEKALLLAQVQALLAERQKMQEQAEAEAKAKAEADAAKAKADAQTKAEAAAKAKTPEPVKAQKANGNWFKAIFGQINKLWPILVLLLALGLLWWFFGRGDQKATNVDQPSAHPPIIVPKVEDSGAAPSVPTPASNAGGKTVEMTASIPTNSLPGHVNSAQSISVSNSFNMEGGINGNNNNVITGNGQANVVVNYNVISNTYVYNGLGKETPVKAGESAGIQIPAKLNCPKTSDGSYRWSKTLYAGQTLPYGFDRTKYTFQVNYDNVKPSDLMIEVKGLDNQWHEVPLGGTNTIAITGYRFTVNPQATEPVELKFSLYPK